MRAFLEVFRKAEIRILMIMTARACGRKAPALAGLSAGESLALYRDFTVRALAGRSRDELLQARKEMYRRAYRVGRMLALLPGFQSEERKRRLIVFLYKNIEIEIRDDVSVSPEKTSGAKTWRIRIPRCSFSGAYTPRTCFVMSGMDAGIICGVFGGGRFSFDERITEGCGACRAVYEKKG